MSDLPSAQQPQDCFFDVLRLWTTSQRSKASKDANHWKRLLAELVWESGKTRRLWLLFFQILKWTQIFDQPQKQVGGDHGIWMFPWIVGWWIMMCLQVSFFFSWFPFAFQALCFPHIKYRTTYHLCKSKARFDSEFCVGGRNRREFPSQGHGAVGHSSRSPNPKLPRCIQFESQHDVGGSISHGQPMQKPQQVTGWGRFMLAS